MNPKKIKFTSGYFRVYFPMDPDLVLEVKRSLPGRFWSEELGCWLVPSNRKIYTPMVDFANRNGFETDITAVEELARLDAPTMIENLPTVQATLRPYQKEGVVYILENERVLLADDMNLGKTLQTLATVEAGDWYPAIVVCPASLRINWEKEIRKFLPHREPGMLLANTIPGNADIFILSYEGLETWLGWIAANLDPAVIILDEAHYIKNYQASRSALCMQLAKLARRKIAITGTPILARPGELMNLLSFLNRLSDFGGFWKFGEKYCKAHQKEVYARNPSGGKPIKKLVWDFSGADNLEELQTKLRESCMLRRTKTEVRKDLPPKVTETVWVPLEPPDLRADYELAVDDFRAWVKEHKKDAKLFKALALTQLGELRRIAVMGKLTAAREWVRNFLEDDPGKLVIFTVHKEPARILAEELECLLVDGDQPPTVREKVLELFHTKELARVLVATIGAAGIGINITAAETALFLELDWTPAVLRQAEDRLRRDQTIFYLLSPGTVDDYLVRVLEGKEDVFNQALNHFVTEEETHEPETPTAS